MQSSPYRQPSAPENAPSSSAVKARRALGVAFWLVCGGVVLAGGIAAWPSEKAPSLVSLPSVPHSRTPRPLFSEETAEPDEPPPMADDTASGRITPNVLERINGGIRGRCWDHLHTKADSANIDVAVTIAPDGRVVSAKAIGDEPAVGMCLEREVMGWVFPRAAKSTFVDLPFRFSRD